MRRQLKPIQTKVNEGPATSKQLQLLKKLGVPDIENLTLTQASKLIQKHKIYVDSNFGTEIYSGTTVNIKGEY